MGKKAKEILDKADKVLDVILEELNKGKVNEIEPITEETAQDISKIMSEFDDSFKKSVERGRKFYDYPRPEVALDKEGAMPNFSIKYPKGLQESIDKMEKFVKDELSFQTLCKSERHKIERLVKLGVLGSDDTRSHNVGASDYSKHLIQPWAIMQDYDLDYWDADIVKRVLRDKKGESKKLDYEKIIHICQEKIRQIG